MKTRKQRIAAFLLCVIFMLTAFSGLLFVTEKTNHSCIGDGCSVCCTIKHFERLFNNGSTPSEPSPFIALAMYLPVALLLLYKSDVKRTSPISLKVKLLN